MTEEVGRLKFNKTRLQLAIKVLSNITLKIVDKMRNHFLPIFMYLVRSMSMPNEELMKFANPFLEIRAIEWGFNNNK